MAIFLFCLILVGLYVIIDPFKVIHKYDNYSDSVFIINKDFVSTETFLNKQIVNNYNAFIFGSSRSMGFNPMVWKQHLQKETTDTIQPYIFDAFEETIDGIYSKLNLVVSKSNPKFVLIILCRDMTFESKKQNEGLVLFKHPETSSNSYLDLHKFYFLQFTNPEYMRRFLDYKIGKKYKPYMRGYFEKKVIEIDPKTNFLQFVEDEKAFLEDSLLFLESRKDILKYRSSLEEDTIPRINNYHKNQLKKIFNILEKEEIRYKVVLSPLFEQMKWNHHDYIYLKYLFGNKLYDFSGKNILTDNIYGYYENSHFRPAIGSQIFEFIYE